MMIASVTKVERLWGLVRAIACSLWLTADLVTFTGEILNGKLHFLFSGLMNFGGECNVGVPRTFLKGGKIMSYLSVEICSCEWNVSKSFTKVQSLYFMISLTKNLSSIKGSGFEEVDFILLYNKCYPSRPVHFWKLYWNKNSVKFLFSLFFVVPQKVLWRPLRPSFFLFVRDWEGKC